MKLYRLFFIVFLLVSHISLAQTPWPPVYEINADSSVGKIDEAYWQMLEDKAGDLSLAEVVRPEFSKKFHRNNTDTTGVGYSGVKDYWQRLRLKNNSGKDINLVFLNVPVVYKFDLYVFRSDGKTEHKLSGTGVPTNQRDTFRTEEAVKMKLAAGEEVIIYKKLHLNQTQSYKSLELGYASYDDFLNNKYFFAPFYLGDTRAAFIAGLLIFGFFLNLFFFWVNREKVYFFYALLLLLEGIWYLLIGTWFIYRHIHVDPSLFDLFITFNLFFFTVTQFVRHFLKTYIYYPRWDKVLLALNISVIVFSLLRLYTDDITPYSWRGIPSFAQNILFFLSNFSLLISFFLPKKEKDPFTTLSVIAAVPAFLMWSMVYGADNVFSFFALRFNIQRPAVLAWLDNNSHVIEMFCVAWFTILFTWILLQRYALLRKQLTQQALERERERTELMKIQTEDLEKQVRLRTGELQQNIENLKNTQQQLIQSEKMASLGELTAGIAHEIQNPLNFVNNFAEVNKELIAELREEIKAGNADEISDISKNIEENEEKIMYHGKRADAIVKSMLQHSRSSTGKKELTDINALADEYLRLAFHGLRAKDKTFNANFKTDFDPAVGKLEIASQEMGRVLLNLFNNAFYAVTDKKKTAGASYDPTVTISTKKEVNKIVIIVNDNGKGIPKPVLDKIFQPFFTTKPAGEGTGLGLSLAYDIIVNGHDGDLQVKTVEGEGTSFLIILPQKQE